MSGIDQGEVGAAIRRNLAPFGIELDSMFVVDRDEYTEVSTTTSWRGKQYNNCSRGTLQGEKLGKFIGRVHLTGHYERDNSK